MKSNNLDKVLQFEQDDTLIKLKPKYNQPKEVKEKSIQIGITNYLSKLHKERVQKVHENRKNLKNRNIFNIMYHNVLEEKAKIEYDDKAQNTDAFDEEKIVKNIAKNVKNQNLNEVNQNNKQIIISKTNLESQTILPPINNNRLKEKEIQSELQINKKIDAGISPEKQFESETNKKVDVGISPEIPHQKHKENIVKFQGKRPKRGPNFSMDNVTLYSMLSKQTRDFFGGMKNKLNSLGNVEKDVSIKVMKMNKIQLKEALMKKIEVTHFLDHKEKSEIPFVSPVATTYKKDFQNYSQKKRYEKIKQKLLELKMVLENDEDNEIKILKEVRNFITKFLFKNGIIEESAYELERINNFIRFVKSDMSNLTLNLSLKQVIDLASFGYFEKKDENKGKNNNKDENNKSKWQSKTNNEMFTNYRSNLENFEKSNKFNKNDEKDLISRLSDELNNPKFHVDINKTQGITRFKSLNNSFLHEHKKDMKSRGEIDKNTNINDLEKIRKNNKLLELIVLQRTKTKLLLEEHAVNENIRLNELK